MPKSRLAREKFKMGCLGNLYANKEAKSKDIKENLGIFTFYLRYFKCLLGLESPNEQKNIPTYAEQDAALQKRIDDLLDEKALLRKDFENAEEQIIHLDAEIQDVLGKLKAVKTDTSKTVSKIRRTKSLRERLKDLTEELSKDGVDIEKMINEMNEQNETNEPETKESE